MSGARVGGAPTAGAPTAGAPTAGAPTGGAPTATDPGFLPELDLALTGMTCASCANRIERKLNKLDGVSASVNFATETAHVAYPASLAPDDLIATVRSAGYDANVVAPEGDSDTDEHAGHADEAASGLRTRLIVSAILTVPLVLVSMIPTLHFPGWQYLALALATPVVAWGGWPFHRATWINLRHGNATMDTLVSLGTLSAYGLSVVLMARHGAMAHLYFETAAVIITFLLAGRYAEARAKRSAGAAITALLDLGAKDALVLSGGDPADPSSGERASVPVSALRVGTRFVVPPGAKVATDGVVLHGTSALDVSLLTGESNPVEVGPGDEVVGASLNSGGQLIVRATRVGRDTHLAQLARLVTGAQSGKAPIQRLADRISAVFVPVVLVIAALTFAGWLWWSGDVSAAVVAAVSVLVIACPCALGLATPTALMVGTGRGAQLGLIIRGPEVLESTRRVDTIVLDKTGTVTSGVMSVADVIPAAGVAEADVLTLAGAVEAASEHPIGAAITAAARAATPGALPSVQEARAESGLGIRGSIAGVEIIVGRPGYLADAGIDLPADLTRAFAAAEATGATVVAVGRGGQAYGLIAVTDTIKDTSAAAISRLREMGLRPILLTGDNEATARAVANTVGITDAADVIAGVLPADKVDVVRRLQESGRVVAMVGDGVNDAAALAQADLGLAMGSGSDVAIEASDLTLIRNDLLAVGDAIALSRKTLGVIKGNLGWAFGYNVAAIPIAAAGLLSPMIAGAAMAASSVFVVLNSLRLRRFQPQGDTPSH